MEGLALTNPGLEAVAAAELSGLLGVPCTAFRSCVRFTVRHVHDLFRTAYKARTITGLLLLLDAFRLGDDPLGQLEERIGKLDLKEWTGKNIVAVRGERAGMHAFNTGDLTAAAARALAQHDARIDFKKPELAFFVHVVDDWLHLGIDLAGHDLGRRPYRIFVGPEALKGNVAAALLRLAGYRPGQSLIDPFCRSGVIPIEAALMAAQCSPHYYAKDAFGFRRIRNYAGEDWDTLFSEWDQGTDFAAPARVTAIDATFNPIANAKKNAKIAGIIKGMDFSRMELEWIDTKFPRGTIDRIVTLPVQPSKQRDPGRMEKLYRLLFHQAAFLLPKTGRILTVMRQQPELATSQATQEGLKLLSEHGFRQGEERMTALVFGRP
jgi:23S rRNA G2445 N2-methylase RlmL